MTAISASPPSFPFQTRTKSSRTLCLSTSLIPCCLPDSKFSRAVVESRYSPSHKVGIVRPGVRLGRFRLRFSGSSGSNTPGSTDSGGNDNRSVLDAFFLGKALAEALNERIESTVGEVLSAVGRFQAEQQKQVQEFQEDVLERAKRAKEKAAREALEAQGLPKSTAIEKSTVTDGTAVISPSAATDGAQEISPLSSDEAIDRDPIDTNPLLGKENGD